MMVSSLSREAITPAVKSAISHQRQQKHASKELLNQKTHDNESLYIGEDEEQNLSEQQ